MTGTGAQGTPWVRLKSLRWGPLQFQSQVAEASPDATPGSTVRVIGPDGACAGAGLYNPRSRYALRVLTRADELLDDAWFRARLERAVELRRVVLGLDRVTDAYRLVHAEGDDLSGLIADKLGDVLSIQVFSLGIWNRLDAIAPVLQELAGCTRLHVHADERIRQAEGLRQPDRGLEGRPETVVAEHGLRFRVRFRPEDGGHKTGFFCDQRDNRLRLAGLVRGRTVLDACCYSGGFACYARKLGGAPEVTAVDLDEKALVLARENAGLNQVRLRTVHADAFSYLRQMHVNGSRFGCVVLDPPKFVSTPAEQKQGRQKYIDINKLAIQVVEPGGLLLSCSCSGLVGREEFLKMVCDAARYVERRIQILDLTGPGSDHPVMADFPEGAYLKAVWAIVL